MSYTVFGHGQPCVEFELFVTFYSWSMVIMVHTNRQHLWSLL